ncbi:LOW QUALITY PROTEIN: hypothetical protein NC651_038218 [Populus alba x Populus x berolinensis]|nr:LOW QUALITY PROTEIN: hypothetical protein NC651_038218 [Populus alba x Populus x berolinensis]
MEGVFDIFPSCRNFKNPAIPFTTRFLWFHTHQTLSLSLSQKEAFKKSLQGRLLHQASSILAFFLLLLHHNLFSRLREIDQTACGVMEEIGNAEILLLRGRKAWRKRRKGFRKLLMLY